MRLLWKKYDAAFDPIITVVGAGFLLGGVYGLSLMVGAVLRHPIAIIIAAIPTVMGMAGVLIIVREVQLYRPQRDKKSLVFVAIWIALTIITLVGTYMAMRR